MESSKNFRRRVLAATGVALEAIPEGIPEDILGGKILCRRGPWVVVTHGYPVSSNPESGAEDWGTDPANYRRVDTRK